MEYSINKLAKMSGVSTRALRYYEELGLLTPKRISSNNYRVYGQNEVDTLQQILFFRELGVQLEEIKTLIDSADFDRQKALEKHLIALNEKQERLSVLIENVTKTIDSMKGEIEMTDNEKFEGFKKNLIDENEKKYGEEIRAKYGEKIVDESNAKLQGLSKEQYERAEDLSREIAKTLKLAIATNDQSSELAQKLCELHKEWLCIYYPKYSREYHLGLADMYLADERFAVYYDNIVEGGTAFLCKAIKVFCGEN